MALDPAAAGPTLGARLQSFFSTARIRGQMLLGDLKPEALKRPLLALTAAALLTGAVAGSVPQTVEASDQMRMPSAQPSLTISGRTGSMLDHDLGLLARGDAHDLDAIQLRISPATAGDRAKLGPSPESGRQVSASVEGETLSSSFYTDKGLFHSAQIDRSIRFDAREVCYRGQVKALGQRYDMTECAPFSAIGAEGQKYLRDAAARHGLKAPARR